MEFARDKYKIPPPRQHQLVLASFDPGDFLFGGGEFDSGESNKIFHGVRKRAKAISPFFDQPIQLFRSGDFRDPPISLNAQAGIVDVVVGEKGGDAGVAVNKLGFVSGDEIEPQLYFEAPARFLSFNLGDGLLEQLAIEIETYRHNVPTLGGAENTAGAADLQIAHGHAKTGAERAVLFDGVDSFACGAHHHELARQQKISVGFVLGTSNPPTQLIQIGQAETIRPINDNGVGIWNVQAAFDDGGADQHIDVSHDKAMHHRFQFIGIHLAVAKLNARIQTEFSDAIAHFLDRLHAIMQKKNLALPFQLALDGIANNSLVITTDYGFDPKPILRRRYDARHVFDAD